MSGAILWAALPAAFFGWTALISEARYRTRGEQR